jgi:HEAT repeat protein
MRLSRVVGRESRWLMSILGCCMLCCSTEATPARSTASSLTAATSARAAEPLRQADLPADLAEAIRVVSEPSGADLLGNQSPFELQVYYRLSGVLLNYRYQPAHAPAWTALLRDERASIYGRLCAAYFLLDQDKEARRFVNRRAHGQNLRHRYNAAKVVQRVAGRAGTKAWAIDLLIALIDSGSLDGSGVLTSPSGNYPDGDRDDILFSPLNDICWAFGHMKVARAVPALIGVLKRRPKTGGAAFALGEIGDPRGVPVLMRMLESDSGYEDREVTALGQLRHRPALPILIKRLNNPRSTFSGLDVLQAKKILEAIGAIGDQSAVDPIRSYLRGNHPKKAMAVARRVLVQLEQPDPVPALVALLNSEKYEPERADILRALSKYRSRLTIQTLTKTATGSPSAFLRREAIEALAAIGNRSALLGLTDALTAPFDGLTAEWGWKIPPDFATYFPSLILGILEAKTGRKLGTDAQIWREWIGANVAQ